jgi:hypothetical protein
LIYLKPEEINVLETYNQLLREYLKGKIGLGVKSNENYLKIGSLLVILGKFTELYPGTLSLQTPNLKKILLNTLQTQSNNKDPSTQLITGAFNGLSHFLKNFGESVGKIHTQIIRGGS